MVDDPVDRERQLKAARAAIQEANKLRQAVLAGSSGEAPYQEAGRLAALSVAASSRDLSELFMRAAKDQFTRSHFDAALHRTSWASNLPDGALAYAYYVIASDGSGLDEANSRWLRAQLDQHGWFLISRYGADADFAAWLLVQHADADPSFQAHVLNLLAPLVPLKETHALNYAYLFDRVAVNSGRPQRYGTQGRCATSGKWEPRSVEAPEQLDERRAAVGLEPEAVYAARFLCRPASPPLAADGYH
ncbi:DUF6624 domain-containing protein [Sphingomonas sp. RS6]